ncbi:TraR/DksA C4-type zinc finger protein [Bdellovibrionota bacterium FG-1]
MDGITIERVRELLMQRWRAIDQSAVNNEGVTGVEMLQQSEMIDLAQSFEQMGRDSSLKEQERRELLALERALSKLSAGGFGTCETCGQEIPARRLMVLPEARLCAHCQSYEERQAARTRPPGVAALR